ncbi:MAG: 2-amino-4-oxopentanoate thiolase subunit OrtA [Bacillota bacterium]
MWSFAKKGDWVQIENTILAVGERAPQVPAETAAVPMIMKAKGFLTNALVKLGDEVTITTLAERKLSGKLIAINPRYQHDFGMPQPELLNIGINLRQIMRGIKNGEE